MGTLRSRKLLRCFYCGRKSSLRFDGQKSFECSDCDATNWLDENGDITDPPSTSSAVETNHVQYAIPRTSAVRSPSPTILSGTLGSDDSPFCATCLRNQHMLTTSLAQFEWPDDVSTAEYATRERKYYALRRDLEERYPQVCADCEPIVDSKLHQACYTAQTDHLKRTLARTRSQRKEPKQRGFLDAVDLAGKWSWYIGFGLQSLWQVALLCVLVTEPYAANTDDLWTVSAMLGATNRLVMERMPDIDKIMQWAINLGMCSFPWNPKFKQTIRGFTAHILGFRQWYTFQLLILLSRVASLSIAQYCQSQGVAALKQFGVQLFIAPLMIYIYQVARKSIRTDTTPLFKLKPKTTASRQKAPRAQGEQSSNDLGSVLDEILHAPTKPISPIDAGSPQASYIGQEVAEEQSTINGHLGYHNTQHGPNFGSLTLSDPPPPRRPEPQTIHYDEEMDWSPSASQHRAFSSYNPYKVKNMNPRFSDAPIEPKSGPIWYKVPAAPTNPAQRLRNPPMRPLIRESPREKKQNFFQSSGRGPVDFGASATRTERSDLNFAAPKFFAPEAKDDPRDGLSNMFASSFSISPDPDDAAVRSARSSGAATFHFQGTGLVSSRNWNLMRIGELVVLLVALWAWIFALGTSEHYGATVALASICTCLIISIRLAADLENEAQIKMGKRPSVFKLAWVNLALAQVIANLFLMWNVWSQSASGISSGRFGSILFGGMIVHHMVHVFV
ncbi:Ima1 N-terminal domain-containing protein [Xylariaceae sp. FL0016]|nr:Ima1 N-terminal domain-containing protein [Xylariaceae sp. FL0016]